MAKIIRVIINPAAGQPKPILITLNDVFHPAGIEWDVSITHQSGDATRYARNAIESGVDVVVAYGGDGMVMEVADAVRGGDIPMAILLGGTANLMSVELGIPKDLAKAAQVAASGESVIRRVDMGQVGERSFMLRVGMGIDGEKVKLADRELKDRWGIMAYSIAALKALTTAPQSHYKFTIDGNEYETDGITCLIDNAGNLGMPGVSASKQISVSDGLLVVIVVRDAGVNSLVAVGAGITDRKPNPDAVKHWQGREITIESYPPQSVQGDGEMWGETPISVIVLPGVLAILTPP